MKQVILFVVFLFSTTQIFSQCACCAGAGIGSSNGDYNNGILTLPKKMLVAESYADYRAIQNGTAPEEDEKLLRSMFIGSFGIRYGLTKKISVSALIPYVFLETDFGNDKGLGDLILLGTFSVYSKNNLNIAIQAGAELRTGIRKNSNFDNTTVIVGSGSYDPMFGVSLAKKWDKLMLQASGLYKQTTEGFEGNYYGSLSMQNLSLSYRIIGENDVCSTDTTNIHPKSKVGVTVFGGYYGEWLDKLNEDDNIDENSGHYLGFATLGQAFPSTNSPSL